MQLLQHPVQFPSKRIQRCLLYRINFLARFSLLLRPPSAALGEHLCQSRQQSNAG